MKNRDIYSVALCLLAEPDETLRLEDYASRAPSLLGGFYYDNEAFDRKYREFSGLGERTEALSMPPSIDGEFPLCQRFLTAASSYLASMLVCDSDSELSDRLLGMCETSLENIRAEMSSALNGADGGNTDLPTDGAPSQVCGESHGIVNVYGNIT